MPGAQLDLIQQNGYRSRGYSAGACIYVKHVLVSFLFFASVRGYVAVRRAI